MAPENTFLAILVLYPAADRRLRIRSSRADFDTRPIISMRYGVSMATNASGGKVTRATSLVRCVALMQVQKHMRAHNLTPFDLGPGISKELRSQPHHTVPSWFLVLGS